MNKQTYEKVWKKRCDDMVTLEKNNNITRNMKKNKVKFKPKNYTDQPKANKETDSTWLLWIQTSIHLGTTWVDF